MDYISILDTVVKVSLGALVSGITATIIIKQKQRQAEKSLRTRRVDTMEDIASTVGSFSHVFSKYSALIVESTRYGDQWPTQRREELERITEELVRIFQRIAEVESKLLLLGEKHLEKSLKLYAGKIAYFRKHVYVGRQDLSEEELNQIKKDIAKLREQFYDILSRRYDKALG